jgi:uncharacterized cofD-like protein
VADVADGADVGRGPAVVALGGGHGLSVALRAARRYAGTLTAVVSVADDGGSSGRLRRDRASGDVLAPGDLRKCLVALGDTDDARHVAWARALEHRFESGDLAGHALGNLLLLGLAESMGDFCAALDEAGRLVGAVGRVLPATTEPVVLKAEVEGEAVEGQTAVSNSSGRIRNLELVPADAPACPDAIAAIARADQVLLAPGSLYTSLLPVLCVQEVRAALRDSPARVVQIANLRAEFPETAGLDATEQLGVVLDHGARVDAFLYESADPVALTADRTKVAAMGVEAVGAHVAAPSGLVHDPAELAKALSTLL